MTLRRQPANVSDAGAGDRGRIDMPQAKAVIVRRRRVARETLKLVAIVVALFTIYFVMPLDLLTAIPVGVTLVVGLLVLGGVSTWEVLAIISADVPQVRALEALVRIIPLFLILFAASYYVMGQADAHSFSGPLTRSESLYFTVTVFSTVGFGDFVATSEISRDAVTFQMILDLVILGLGVRVLTRAVQVGTDRKQQPGANPDPPPRSGAADAD